MKLLLILTLFTSCAPISASHIHVVRIDFAFQQYFVDFENDAISTSHFQNIDDLIIQFNSSTPSEWAGYCLLGTTTTSPEINISPSAWTEMTTDQQQELIYHEMGHCVLNRVHKTTLWSSVPDSIMWPQVFPAGLFTQYHDHYVVELFTGQP